MRKERRWLTAVCVMLWCVVMLCGTAWALMDGIVWPEATGEVVETADKLTIDESHMEKGFVMVHGPATDKALKLQVEKDGAKLMYDINGKQDWEIIPLQLGDGKYTFSLFVSAGGNKYASGGKLAVNAKLDSQNAAYLVPTQYVYYEVDTPAVAKSDEICEGLTTDQEKFDAIREYIKENYEYDFKKAQSALPAGTLPSVDYAWEKGMGICQDLAALAACMLRVQGIPTRLEIGYVGGNYYHAWNSVVINGQAVQYDPTVDVTDAIPGGNYRLERYY